jgi:hypothetical protein
MNTANDIAALVDNLAGHWTDSALEILKALDVPAISIDLELATWQALKQALQSHLREQQWRPSTGLEGVLTNVLHRATLQVAQQFAPWSEPAEWESRIQLRLRDRHATTAERVLFAQLVRQRLTKSASGLSRRKHFDPQFSLVTVGG